jgi:hypothetical protein
MLHPPLQKIARRLAVTADRQQVIDELCTQYGLHWQDAESIVAQAESEYQHIITRQQTPILVLVAFSTFSIGVLLFSWSFLGVVSSFTNLVAPNLVAALNLLGFYSDMVAALLDFSNSGSLFVIGLAMMLGSQWGMKSVWLSWLQTRENEVEPPASPEMQQFEVKQDLLDSIIRQLKRGQTEAKMVAAVQARTGMAAEDALAFVRQVIRSRGDIALTSISPAALLAGWMAFISGVVLIIQNVFLLDAHLRASPRNVQNSWGLLLRIRDISDYAEAHPILSLWFAFGVICLVAGYFSIRVSLHSVLLRLSKKHHYD